MEAQARRAQQENSPARAGLTPREAQVARAAADGQPAGETAAALGLTGPAVANLQSRIRRKQAQPDRLFTPEQAKELDQLAGERVPGRKKSEGLSHREEEVLAALALGLTNAAIGKQLGISIPTIKTHLHRIGQKSGQHNRLALALWAKERSKDARVAPRPTAAAVASGPVARRAAAREPRLTVLRDPVSPAPPAQIGVPMTVGFEGYDTLERPAQGWSVYTVESGTLKQRLPGRYENRMDAEAMAEDYRKRFGAASDQKYEVLPYDKHLGR